MTRVLLQFPVRGRPLDHRDGLDAGDGREGSNIRSRTTRLCLLDSSRCSGVSRPVKFARADAERQQVLVIESRIDANQLDEAAREESGTHQEDDGDGHFRHDEDVSQAMADAAGYRRPSAFLSTVTTSARDA